MEIFKEISGYDGYLVSTHGNVFSLASNRLLKPGKFSNGYLFVNLGGRKCDKSQLVHRLVAIAFIPNPENKRTVNHKDGIKDNNHYLNLEWNTHSENERHAWGVGLKKTEQARLLKISKPVNQYDLEGKLIRRFPSANLAGKSCNTDASSIIKACRGKVKYTKGFIWKYADL